MSETSHTTSRIEVYVPVVAEASTQDRLAERPHTLNGKTVGLLNNTKDLVDVLLDEVKAQVRAAFSQAKFRDFRKLSVSGAAPELLEDLATCDAVVTAVGD